VRIVVDTSVVIAALRSRSGASGEILRRVADGTFVICMDYKLCCEYRDVAMRPEHLKAANMTRKLMAEFLDLFERSAEPVNIVRKYRPLSVDPNDDMVLDVAINAGADAIVTHNVRHLLPGALRFQIKVMRPGEFLRSL
jgi:putative PIN family toxin of toxin-antitoxin system